MIGYIFCFNVILAEEFGLICKWTGHRKIQRRICLSKQGNLSLNHFLLRWLFWLAGIYESREMGQFLKISDLHLPLGKDNLCMRPLCMCIESRINMLTFSEHDLTIDCNFLSLFCK
jgi:hypothetical protein